MKIDVLPSKSHNAIVVITYNRLLSLKRLVSSLQNANYLNDRIDLIFSIDKSTIYKEIEDYCNSVEWNYGEKNIYVQSERLGLKRHILKCGDFLNHYSNIFVFEDDLFVSSNFYIFGKLAIEKYENDDNIAGISLYTYSRNQYANLPFFPIIDEYDVFFMKVASSWGQIWSSNKWAKFVKWLKLNDSIDNIHIPNHIKLWGDKSWLKYHHAYCADQGKYFVYPRVSLSTNFSEPGEHASLDSTYQVILQSGCKLYYVFPNNILQAVRYDAFFENENLQEYLNVTYPNIVIDLYGGKYNYGQYLLSTEKINCEIIKTYALRMKTWESNIFHDIPGEDICLYKTDGKVVKKKHSKANVYKYLFKINSPRPIMDILRDYILNKIKKWVSYGHR